MSNGKLLLTLVTSLVAMIATAAWALTAIGSVDAPTTPEAPAIGFSGGEQLGYEVPLCSTRESIVPCGDIANTYHSF